MAFKVSVPYSEGVGDASATGFLTWTAGSPSEAGSWSILFSNLPQGMGIGGPAVPFAGLTIRENNPGGAVTFPEPVLLLLVQDDETPFAIGGVNTQFNGGNEGSGWGMYQTNSGAFILGVGSKNMTMVSAAGTTDFTTDVGANGFRIKNPVTFASLPASPVKGQMAYITDCNSTTFHAVAAGGGANNILVVYDGTSWRIGG